jgi:hypothetical protein
MILQFMTPYTFIGKHHYPTIEFLDRIKIIMAHYSCNRDWIYYNNLWLNTLVSNHQLASDSRENRNCLVLNVQFRPHTLVFLSTMSKAPTQI